MRTVPPDPDSGRSNALGADELRDLWTAGLEEMRPGVHGIRERDAHRRIEILALRYLDGRGALLDLRGEGFPSPTSLAHHDDALAAHRAALDELRRSGATGVVTPDFVRLQTDCLRHLELARIRLVLSGGHAGGGSGAVAGALGARYGAVVLRTAELDPAELLRRAERLLSLGEQVVLDGPWSERAHRDGARTTALRTSSDAVELWVQDGPTGGDGVVPDDFDPWPEATVISLRSGFDASLRQAAIAAGWSR